MDPDAEVVARVLTGDIVAFELMMRRYNQRLFRIARGILGEDAAAEDVVQEAYLRAFKSLATFEGRSSFATWLTRIAVYESLATQRRKKRMSSVDGQKLESAGVPMRSLPTQPDDQAENRELGRVLSDAVDALPVELREVFTLRVLGQLDTCETAHALGMSESNVKVRLHRGRTQLRQIIDDRIGAEVRRLYQFDGLRCDRLVTTILTRLGTSSRSK